MKVATVSEMREMDRAALQQYGISAEILMENAGHGAYAVLSKEAGLWRKKVVVLCGPGNNGGDGFVTARKIHSGGGDVTVLILGEKNEYQGAAGKNLDILSRMPVEIRPVASVEEIGRMAERADFLIDALFGTGLSREVEGIYKEAIPWLNGSGKKILSLDIPSGISGDTGHIMGVAVRANYTVTFGLPKVGNLLYPGYEHCGKLYVTHISFPPSLYQLDSLKLETNNPPGLPPRDRTGHKGTFGNALVIAGASSYFGAPYFASMSFLKAGGGYCRLAAPRPMIPSLAGKASEVVFIPQGETADGSISLANKDPLLELAAKMDVVILGPGMSLEEETQHLIRELAVEIRKPMIIDGDGITAICRDLSVMNKRKAETILTPHPGEMSRITGRAVSEILDDPITILRQTAGNLNAFVVLKGAHSLIGYPDDRVFINFTGNPGMASAGSGDVLTGAVAAMLCLGLPAGDALRKGVFIHGLAADLAAKKMGEDGITARNILRYLPYALKREREEPDFATDCCSGVQMIL
jgi:hydroxyethylthiazole kinase-like uncharacterized protein yjeF